MQKEKFFELLGWIGMVTAILMYVFYFQQIQQNLSGGPKGNFLQPFMAGINCTFWVLRSDSVVSVGLAWLQPF